MDQATAQAVAAWQEILKQAAAQHAAELARAEWERS